MIDITVDTTEFYAGDDGDTTHFGGDIKFTNNITEEVKELNCRGETDRSCNMDEMIWSIIFDWMKFTEEQKERFYGFYLLDIPGKVFHLTGEDPENFNELDYYMENRFKVEEIK